MIIMIIIYKYYLIVFGYYDILCVFIIGLFYFIDVLFSVGCCGDCLGFSVVF